jgi:hypothetical protein
MATEAGQATTLAYPRVYGVTRGWKIFFTVFGIATTVGMAFLIDAVIRSNHQTSPVGLILIVGIFLASMALGAYCGILAFRSKILLFPDYLEIHDAIRVQTIRRADIAGTRIRIQPAPGILILVPRQSGRKPIKVSLLYKFDDAFDEWMNPVPDLDVEETVHSYDEIEADQELGATPDERIGTLNRGRQWARALNVAAATACAWGLFRPLPYVPCVLCLSALPWLAVIIVARSPALFRIDQYKNDPRPTVGGLWAFPGFILMLRSVVDGAYTFDWPRALLVAGVIGVALWTAAMKADPSIWARGWVSAIALLIVALPYGLGVGLEANTLLDRSQGIGYTPSVVEKHIYQGKRTEYRLTLTPWGPQTTQKSIGVPREVYNSVSPGDTMCLALRKGALGIRWYIVGSCSR